MFSPSRIKQLSQACSKLSPPARKLLAEQLRANLAKPTPGRKLYGYFPDEGPLRRELYVRHMQFFLAGAPHEPMPVWCPEDCDGSPHRDRLALCANRVGKTESMGGYESTLHLTGRYPSWWQGHRFLRPIDAWACGKRNETVRDIVQRKLFGAVTWKGRYKSVTGTGLIPAEDIGEITWKRGVADFIDTAKIKHATGQWSSLGLKSYEQGRGAF